MINHTDKKAKPAFVVTYKNVGWAFLPVSQICFSRAGHTTTQTLMPEKRACINQDRLHRFSGLSNLRYSNQILSPSRRAGMPILRSRSRGLTLVECLVFVVIWSSVSIASLWAIQEASLMRGKASQRAELAAVAQSELEQARALPAADLRPGPQIRPAADWWPAGTSCTVTLTPQSPAAWLVDVQVDRATTRGLRPVRLTSVRRAGL